MQFLAIYLLSLSCAKSQLHGLNHGKFRKPIINKIYVRVSGTKYNLFRDDFGIIEASQKLIVELL